MNSDLRPYFSMSAMVLLALFLSRSRVASASTSPPSEAPACTAPEYRQFDFWAGDWDAFDVDNPTGPVAHVRVDRILDGCVLLEDYQGVNGSHGESFSIYDAAKKAWHQTWVTNRGVVVLIDGRMRTGAMELSGVEHTIDQNEKRVRGTWETVEGGVRETGVTSGDGGKTWHPWFDLMFRPAKNSTGHQPKIASDQALVAALDTEYQAAVKHNDVATMDRLLADDFILVTGSERTYTKADLLAEARSGQFVYEHQEDREQMVRVWGDTAVITAKLWAKGMKDGRPFDYDVLFSDTYARTGSGWRYVFGQSSLPVQRTDR